MKTIIFCKAGEAISDFEVSERVDEFLGSLREEWKISTCLPLHEIRARVKEDKVKRDDLTIYVENEHGDLRIFDIDKDGRSWDWGKTLDVYSNILMRLL